MDWSVFSDIDKLRAAGSDPSVIQEATEWNRKWKMFLASPIGPYLDYGDPEELWKRPEGPLLSFECVSQNALGSPPCSTLFEFGFLPVWTSHGGNVVAYHPDTQAFYWAHHESFFFKEVMVPKTHELLPLNYENLMKALVKVSDEECGAYLRSLRDGRYPAEVW